MLNLDDNQLPYQTRVEFSPQRGRNVLIFSDKQIQVSIAYPLPDAYEGFGTSEYQKGVSDALHLVYIEARNEVFKALQQQTARSPATEALTIETEKPA